MRSMKFFSMAMLTMALSASAVAGAAVPPVPMSATGNVEHACFSGKSLFRSIGMRHAHPDYFKPYVPPGSVLKSCIVDSGCSIHMFSDRHLFSSLAPSKVTLQTADKRNHSVDSEGPVTLRGITNDGTPRSLVIGRTLHTPAMHNLLSCFGLVDSGGIVHLEHGNSYVKLRDDTVFPVRQRGRLFYLDYLDPAKHARAASAPTSTTKSSPARACKAACNDSDSASGLPRDKPYEAPMDCAAESAAAAVAIADTAEIACTAPMLG